MLTEASLANQYGQPDISAQAALLMDVDNGQILYGQNFLEHRAMASTTKIMTAIIAIAGADLQGIAKVSPRAASVGESSMYLKTGELLTLEQLMYGALLNSGNDACVAIAEHLVGSEEMFVLLMNEKARLMGAQETNFGNVNGLPALGHHSTALDLALIARNALHNPNFCRIVNTRSKLIKGLNGSSHYLLNTNKLLWSYPGADGVKTGTTVEAGKCLIASATKKDRRLLTVILNGDDRFNDANLLFDYGYKEFKVVYVVYASEIFSRINVIDGVVDTVPVKPAGDIRVNVRCKGSDQLEKKVKILRSIEAPVYEGQPLGSVTISIDGNEVGSTELVAACTVNKLLPIQKAKKKISNIVFCTLMRK